MITARNALDRVADDGADDYVAKPYSLSVVRPDPALLRRDR